MTRIFLFIKHNLPILWRLIEWMNGIIFSVLYRRRLLAAADNAIRAETQIEFRFVVLDNSNLKALADLLASQPAYRLAHFRPHEYDFTSIKRQSRNPAFLMFGAFSRKEMVGYFFLRCFVNRRCFVGRLIDHRHDRLGIGRAMNRIMYQTAWNSGFRVFTTVSKENEMVIRSHSRNPAAKVLKELPNNYLLIEFLPGNTSLK